jgi:hypothetical protein
MAHTIVTLPPREAYQIRCHRCGHVWLYTGRNRHYAQCSRCRTTVTLYLNEECDEERLEKYLPQTGPRGATNSQDQNAVTVDTTTSERDHTRYE